MADRLHALEPINDHWQPVEWLGGGAEMLLDQDTLFAQKAQQAGSPVTLRVWEDCFHDWPVYAVVVRDGGRAIDEAARFIQALPEPQGTQV